MSACHRLATFVALLGTLLTTSTALADGVADEAELQFQLGVRAYRTADYETALQHFLAANRLVPNVNVVYNVARAYEQLQRPADAFRYYVDALEGERDEAQRGRINEAIARLAAVVPVVEVVTDPAGADLYVDRIDLGTVGRGPRLLSVSPGRHTLWATADGYEPGQSAPFEVAAGQRVAVRIGLVRIVGTLRLSVPEDAEVRIDTDAGAPACTGSCEVALPPGRHVLYVTQPGFRPIERDVVIRANEVTESSPTLAAFTGSILVTTEEPGARVEVDGELSGFTPAVIQAVAVGRHRVRVSSPGYVAVEQEVEVVADRQTELRDVRLETPRDVTAASRNTETIDDAPASISLITSQEMSAFQFPTILEALRGTRGFALTFDSIYSNAAVRGVGQPNDYSNRLLILADGAILNENILNQVFIGFDGRVDLGDVDRIEVVRGPGSVLYGTGAVSGVVNLVPTSTTDTPTHARFGFSTYDTVGRARAAFHWRKDEDRGIAASISAGYSNGYDGVLSFDGDGDMVDEPNLAPGIDEFGAWTTVGRAWNGPFKLQWMVSGREDMRIPTGSFGTIFGRRENQYDDRRALLEARFEPALTDEVDLLTRVYANLTYFDLEYVYEDDLDEDPATPVEEYPYAEHYDGIWIGGEVRASYRPTEGMRLALGAEVTRHAIIDMVGTSTLPDGPDTSLDVDQPFTTGAGYGLFEWRPGRALRLSAGTRIDVWGDRSRAPANPGDPAAGPSFVSINPRVAMIVSPTENDVIKVMGGRSFRAPTIYELYYTDGGVTQELSTCDGAPLEPEGFFSGEVEYLHRFDRSWSALGAVHGMLAQNFIDTVDAESVCMTDPGVNYYDNLRAEQLLAGFDLEVRREFRSGWMVSASYGYLRSQFIDAGSDPRVGANTRITNAPEHFAAMRGIVPLISRSLTGAFRIALEAPRRIDLATDDETEWAVITDLVFTGRMPDYDLVYSIGAYNLLDWVIDLPSTPYAARTIPQRGRALFASLAVEVE